MVDFLSHFKKNSSKYLDFDTSNIFKVFSITIKRRLSQFTTINMTYTSISNGNKTNGKKTFLGEQLALWFRLRPTKDEG
jgi:hypothetical protein